MSDIHADLLERSRREMLDLSTRNRLLSIPSSVSARIIQVVDERSEEIYRILVREKKSMTFLATDKQTGGKSSTASDEPDSDDADDTLPQPEDTQSSGPAQGRHLDNRLQTRLTGHGLQRRLLDISRDAQTMLEEQGVNILYLVLGQLKWYEAATSDLPRYAPLILLPVNLTRKSASDKISISSREEDVQENLSLRAKLKADFDLDMPDFPEDESFAPEEYFAAIKKAIVEQPRWEVLPNAITLGFFSFAKFLMFRDLDPSNWPGESNLLGHPLISALLSDGFPPADPPFTEDAHLDDHIPAARLDLVVDADSSQTIAIEMVRLGHNLVIQGPPGTGKSQSITNIISTAVLDGKKVLFVAEKLAALEVVKRRMEQAGLGDLCLELHSNKANKKAVIEQIDRTWNLGRPKGGGLDSIITTLDARRTVLNKHAKSLHTRQSPSGLTPFFIIGSLAALQDQATTVAHVTFDRAESWSPSDYKDRINLLSDLANRLNSIGLPTQHPWRGVCNVNIIQIDLPVISSHLNTFVTSVSSLNSICAELAGATKQQSPTNFAEVDALRSISECAASAPSADRQALCHDIWNEDLNALRKLIQFGREYCAIFSANSSKVDSSVWKSDFTIIRTHIAAYGCSLFRLFNADYRKSIAEFRGILKVPLPSTFADRLALLDHILAGQRSLRFLAEHQNVGDSAFGSLWRGPQSDWDQLEAIIVWMAKVYDAGLGKDFLGRFAAIQDPIPISNLLTTLIPALSSALQLSQELCNSLQLDLVTSFGKSSLSHIPFESFLSRAQLWQSQLNSLIAWCQYYSRASEARSRGLAPLLDLLEAGSIPADSLSVCFHRIYYSQLLRDILRRNPDLARFDGGVHEKHIAEFQAVDRERMTLAKHHVLDAHFKSFPPLSGIGPAGIVKGELVRKRGHMPIRKLLQNAGTIIQSIKPVFMMSPLSVAQFLAPGAVEFDLLVIDEASQVQPADAFGAIARCRQIVVVGDNKQLPPTRFFARLTSSQDDAELPDGDSFLAAQAQDVESILGLCCARGLPSTMLRWHYRSRHHSLIAVSNKEFYSNDLFIVPSPLTNTSELGLRFVHVPDGIFDSGGSGCNRIESKRICQAILEHARQSPQLSLGVAAFSVRQSQAILDELELLRRENPELEPFFTNHSSEPFFVKNLENVQGDERDVIFISVGYARNSSGYMAMRFGPLSAQGGERRLNVLISRAKQTCVVFSSITADDIDLERASGIGVAALKTFLHFAATGRLGIPKKTDNEMQSPFEESVYRSLVALGYTVHPQVGVSGFFIDFAIIDKNLPGRYLLGVECDGASYHSSRSARDRDRLRQAVLEDHGWIIHRVWSTDWFQRRQDQIDKL